MKKNKRSVVQRIAFDIGMLIGIAFVPWWMVLIIGIVGIFLFSRFFEAVIAGAVVDALYNPTGFPTATLAALVVFVSTYYLKHHMRIDQ